MIFNGCFVDVTKTQNSINKGHAKISWSSHTENFPIKQVISSVYAEFADMHMIDDDVNYHYGHSTPHLTAHLDIVYTMTWYIIIVIDSQIGYKVLLSIPWICLT